MSRWLPVPNFSIGSISTALSDPLERFRTSDSLPTPASEQNHSFPVDDIVCTMTCARTDLHITSKTRMRCHSCIHATEYVVTIILYCITATSRTRTHTLTHAPHTKQISILGWDHEVGHVSTCLELFTCPSQQNDRDIAHLLHVCEPLAALRAQSTQPTSKYTGNVVWACC